MSLNMPYRIDEEILYPAIQVVADPAFREIKDVDFLYDIQQPALVAVETAATLIADAVWYRGEPFDWAPQQITDAVKKGMKCGYLLGKAVFHNG